MLCRLKASYWLQCVCDRIKVFVVVLNQYFLFFFFFFRAECYIYIFPRWTSEYFLQEMRATSKTIFLLQPRSFPAEFWMQHERQDLSSRGMRPMWERLYWRPLIFLTKKVWDKSSIKKFQLGPFWLMFFFFLSSFPFFFKSGKPTIVPVPPPNFYPFHHKFIEKIWKINDPLLSAVFQLLVISLLSLASGRHSCLWRPISNSFSICFLFLFSYLFLKRKSNKDKHVYC